MCLGADDQIDVCFGQRISFLFASINAPSCKSLTQAHAFYSFSLHHFPLTASSFPQPSNQLMKFTQNPCKIRLPNTKSANALSLLTLVPNPSLPPFPFPSPCPFSPNPFPPFPVPPSPASNPTSGPCTTVSPVPASTSFAAARTASAEAPLGRRSVVCRRREARRTNWPTAAEKEDRKALKG